MQPPWALAEPATNTVLILDDDWEAAFWLAAALGHTGSHVVPARQILVLDRFPPHRDSLIFLSWRVGIKRFEQIKRPQKMSGR